MEQQIRTVEEELQRLYAEFESRMNEFQHAGSSTIDLETAIQAEEGMVVRLLHQLEELYRSGSATIDSLYRQRDAVLDQFNGSAQHSPNTDALQQRLEEIEAQIAQSDGDVNAQIEVLEQQLFALEDEVRQLYHAMEERMRALHEEFQQRMWDMDDRRFELQEQWRTVDEEMRRKMELEALYEQQRAVEMELQAAKREVEPIKQEMEAGLLDLLETALGRLSEGSSVEGPPAEGSPGTTEPVE